MFYSLTIISLSMHAYINKACNSGITNHSLRRGEDENDDAMKLLNNEDNRRFPKPSVCRWGRVVGGGSRVLCWSRISLAVMSAI